MVRTRWLLVLHAEAEPDGAGLMYNLWLYELDGPPPRLYRRCTSVEELYAAIFADQHAGTGGEG